MGKLTKHGLNKINMLLNSFYVEDYHKTLLKAIKHNSSSNNLSISDSETVKLLLHDYKHIKEV